MEIGALSLLPPLVTLALGMATRRISLSLFGGIFVAAFFATDFSVFQGFIEGCKRLLEVTEIPSLLKGNPILSHWNSLICFFLFCLGILVTAIRQSGGSRAYGRFVKRFLRSGRSAEGASLLMSKCLFIDDYLSSLTVGSVMRPITDQYRIPRVKLAFLVDAMAAPLAILCPFSSWVAMIMGHFRDNGIAETGGVIAASPFQVYLLVIPFIFYSFTLIAAVWFIVWKKISYGAMSQFEGDPPKAPKVEKIDERSSMCDFFVPIFFLVSSIVLGMMFSGGVWIFGGERSIGSSLQNSSAATALAFGGMFALVFSFAFLVMRGKLLLKELPSLCWEGIRLMAPAVGILLLAWTLGDLLRADLKTGEYLASLLKTDLTPTLLPFLLFAFSTLIAFATGSSWGTAAIVIPIAIPLIIALSGLPTPLTPEQLPLLVPTLGAVFSGCVAGDHISPISDTTMMSSTSTECSHIDHVRTQLHYSLPVIIGVGASYLLWGLIPMQGSSFQYAVAQLSSIVISIGGISICQRAKGIIHGPKKSSEVSEL